MNYELRVNPIACDGHGVCAELLPEIIELDPWGYPILMSAKVPRGLAEHAKRAAAACPVLALLVDRTTGERRSYNYSPPTTATRRPPQLAAPPPAAATRRPPQLPSAPRS